MLESLTETPEEAAGMAAMQQEAPQPAAAPAPVVPPEPTPEPAATPAAQEPAAQHEKPTRLVPHAALHEERTRRQALERELADLRKAAPPPPARQAPEEEPDETTDPIGALAYLKNKIKARETEEAEGRAESQRIHELGTKVRARIDSYSTEHPEYTDQLAFLRKSRAEELKVLGYPDQMIVRQLMQEEMAIGQKAIDDDLDPGEVIAKLATHRGWKGKEPEPAAVVPNPAPTVPPGRDPAKTIERLQKGIKSAISSSAGGGGGPETEMTLDNLLKLDGAAFDKAFEAHGKRLMN